MKNKITVIVPATSANCGPGYDSLGLACNLYNDFTFEILRSWKRKEADCPSLPSYWIPPHPGQWMRKLCCKNSSLLPPVSRASVPAHFQSHFIIWRGGTDAAPQL